MKAIHFGAGNIGRGLIGQVLHKNHFEIVFLDTNNEIISQINQKKGYFIEYLNEEKKRFFIGNTRAINLISHSFEAENEILTADIITTSVGVDNLKRIAPIIKSALLKRATISSGVNILANENSINASDILKNEIKNISTAEEWQRITTISYFVNTAIDRQSLSKIEDNINIAIVEPYFEWVIDRTQLNPNTPYSLSNVVLVDELQPFIERKLFIVNAEHAAFAYLGAFLGYQTIQQSIADKRINILVRQFLQENSTYFMAKYAMDKSVLESFIEKTIIRHGNPILSDPIVRVGKSPIRKLGKSDRLVSPVVNLHKRSMANDAGKKIIAAAYLYYHADDPESIEIQQMITDIGIENTLRKISDLPDELISDISKIYKAVKDEKNVIFNQ